MVAVLDDFIGWCDENRAKRTTWRYKDFIQAFVKATVDGVKLGKLDSDNGTTNR